MRRPGFLIVGLIVFGSVALGLAALAGNISLRERNIVPSTSFRRCLRPGWSVLGQ
jgi:hypothetical protein